MLPALAISPSCVQARAHARARACLRHCVFPHASRRGVSACWRRADACCRVRSNACACLLRACLVILSCASRAHLVRNSCASRALLVRLRRRARLAMSFATS
eukprot:2276866-Pleurochrysis_carterae.AAC.3